MAPTGHQTRNWVGWEAGLTFNSVFGKSHKKVSDDDSHGWFLGLAGNAGAGWDKPYTKVYGGELFTQRDLGNSLSAILSVGYTTFAADKDYVFYHISQGNLITEAVAKPYHIIPVKFGIRSMVTKRFYIGGDFGEAWAKRDDGIYQIQNGVRMPLFSTETQTVKSFVFSATAGFNFGNRFDAGVKFEDYTGFTEIKQFALRLAYKIKLTK
jgi:hypothetical protein